MSLWKLMCLLALFLISIQVCWANDGYKDMAAGNSSLLITRYAIDSNGGERVAVVYVQSTLDTAIESVNYTVFISGEPQYVYNVTIKPGRKYALFLYYKGTIEEGETISLAVEGVLVQSIPLPEVGDYELADAVRNRDGSWDIVMSDHEI